MRIDYSTNPDFSCFEDTDHINFDSNFEISQFDTLFLEAVNGGTIRKRRLAERNLSDQINSALENLKSNTRDSLLLEMLAVIGPKILEMASNEMSCRRGAPSSPDIYLRPKFDGGRFAHLRLRDKTLSEIRDLLADEIGRLRTRASEGARTREELSVNSGPLIRRVARILQEEHRTTRSSSLLREYFGADFEVSGLALELSPAGSSWWAESNARTSSRNTLYCHVDERIDYPKSIIYLSDVGEENGPFSVFPEILEQLNIPLLGRWFGRLIGTTAAQVQEISEQGSYHRPFKSENLRRLFMKLPPDLRFQSHFGWDVVAGSEAEKEIVSKEKVFLGPAGTMVLFDGGELVHRGGLTSSGDRIALQVVYRKKVSVAKKVGYKLENSRPSWIKKLES